MRVCVGVWFFVFCIFCVFIFQILKEAERGAYSAPVTAPSALEPREAPAVEKRDPAGGWAGWAHWVGWVLTWVLIERGRGHGRLQDLEFGVWSLEKEYSSR